MLFQKATTKFTRDCPLSGKDAPVINYKNLKLLQKYISETGKMLPSRITSVCYAKQKELSNEDELIYLVRAFIIATEITVEDERPKTDGWSIVEK